MANVKFFFAEKKRTTESRQTAKELGGTGEAIASRFLEDQGYVIIDRNYRRGHNEADLIALDHGELVVVEVKTRSNDDYLQPEDAVDHQKRQILIKIAHNYIKTHNRTEPLRFDIIAIIKNDNKTRINHIKNAFNVMSF